MKQDFDLESFYDYFNDLYWLDQQKIIERLQELRAGYESREKGVREK